MFHKPATAYAPTLQNLQMVFRWGWGTLMRGWGKPELQWASKFLKRNEQIKQWLGNLGGKYSMKINSCHSQVS